MHGQDLIEQYGESRTVPLAPSSRDEAGETLLKLLVLGNQDVHAGRISPVLEVVARLRDRRPAA